MPLYCILYANIEGPVQLAHAQSVQSLLQLNAQANLNLRRAHMSKGTFSDVAAQLEYEIYLLYFIMNHFEIAVNRVSEEFLVTQNVYMRSACT